MRRRPSGCRRFATIGADALLRSTDHARLRHLHYGGHKISASNFRPKMRSTASVRRDRASSPDTSGAGTSGPGVALSGGHRHRRETELRSYHNGSARSRRAATKTERPICLGVGRRSARRCPRTGDAADCFTLRRGRVWPYYMRPCFTSRCYLDKARSWASESKQLPKIEVIASDPDTFFPTRAMSGSRPPLRSGHARDARTARRHEKQHHGNALRSREPPFMSSAEGKIDRAAVNQFDRIFGEKTAGAARLGLTYVHHSAVEKLQSEGHLCRARISTTSSIPRIWRGAGGFEKVIVPEMNREHSRR